MNIFITGGTGFIGKRLALALAKEGHAVYVLARKKSFANGWRENNIIQIQGDIEDPLSYEKVFDNNIDIVYHLAAIPGQKWKYKEKDYQRVNVRGTADLLGLSKNKIKKFIFCSSINAIGNSTGFHNDPYGKSKFQAENLVKKENSFETIIIRPAVVYGPSDTGGMFLKMCLMIKRHAFFLVGSGKNIISVVYIDDLLNGFLKAKDVSKNGQIFEIVGSDNISIEKIAEIIAKNLGTTISKIHIPIWLARLVVSMLEILSTILHIEPILTNHRVDIMTKNNPISFEKAREELGYIPQTKFEEGMKITIDWYKKNGFI